MAVPIIPILKKIGTAVLSNKKGRKVIGGIILGSLVLLMTPAAVVLGIFSGSMDINTDGVQTIVKDRQETEEKRYAEIEQTMTEAGYSEIKIREAQAIYSFALFNLCQAKMIRTLQKRRYLCAFLQILGWCTYSTTVLAFATNHQKYRRFCCMQV